MCIEKRKGKEPQGKSSVRKKESKGATGNISAYQFCAPTISLQQGVAMASSPGPLHGSQQLGEEASRKRELRLLKNRQAAKECRRRKRECINCLEAHVSMLQP
ncbi:cAMP-responsive element modulator-like isoform X3 [Neoarius graeffei]|uniref:cAMP-responsive element modulator-like isoform X3 n=1 Tax=Neoarius graeffei TaxID=443677 RepID=UPI00298C190B|nr:cAMP-responsive element modulator-like isoform X3 [Neoarius graeffei]